MPHVRVDESDVPYVAGSDTSEMAARMLENPRSKRDQVYAVIVAQRSNGITDETISAMTGMQLNTVRPRRVELVQMGLVKDSGLRRNTRSRRAAVLWVAT